jgi:hypothetical protein
MIIEMGNYRNDAKYIDPKIMAESFLKELPEINCNKAMILILDDTQDKYEVGFLNAKMSCSEMVSLLRTVEIILFQHMGYVPRLHGE